MINAYVPGYKAKEHFISAGMDEIYVLFATGGKSFGSSVGMLNRVLNLSEDRKIRLRTFTDRIGSLGIVAMDGMYDHQKEYFPGATETDSVHEKTRTERAEKKKAANKSGMTTETVRGGKRRRDTRADGRTDAEQKELEAAVGRDLINLVLQYPGIKEASGRQISDAEIEAAMVAINSPELPPEFVVSEKHHLECKESAVYISVDDVLVVEQKDWRRKPVLPEVKAAARESFRIRTAAKTGGTRVTKNLDRRYVHHTNIYIKFGDKSYALTCVDGMVMAFRLLIAFLMENDLLQGKDLVFFSDGAKDIKRMIELFFGFRPYQLILDWFHVKKRLEELLSTALNGKAYRNEVLDQHILTMVWRGKIDDAITFLRNDISKNKIKQSKDGSDLIEKVVTYLTDRRDDIACNALRRWFGLKVSSNAVEKTNDLLVASRQKHNGMSWSVDGSASLAILTSICRNGGLTEFIDRKEVPFRLMTRNEEKAA